MSVHMYGHQYAEPDDNRQHRRAAVRDYRQRHAADGDDPDDHGYVDKGLREKVAGDGQRDQPPGLIVAAQGDHHAARDDQTWQRHQGQAAGEAEFLAGNGEIENGLFVRQEIKVRLHTVPETLAAAFARTFGRVAFG